MVRRAEPSTARVTSSTHSRNWAKDSRPILAVFWCCSSFQASLIRSHISVVRAVRTARPLARAVDRQEWIEDGLSGSKARKSRTLRSVASSYLA